VARADTATVHKSQGSEYPAGVSPLSTQPDPMLERNPFGIGVTCAKQFGVIIGQPRSLGLAVRTVKSRRRLTHLSARRQPHCRDSGIARESVDRSHGERRHRHDLTWRLLGLREARGGSPHEHPGRALASVISRSSRHAGDGVGAANAMG
jgi:hypothetical protein